MDPEVFNNYRPVANITVSKIIERVGTSQLTVFLECNQLLDTNQSAFSRKHSTETCLLKTMNEILCQLDENALVIVLGVDLSAAFDTIDYQVLSDILDGRFKTLGVSLGLSCQIYADDTLIYVSLNKKPNHSTINFEINTIKAEIEDQTKQIMSAKSKRKNLELENLIQGNTETDLVPFNTSVGVKIDTNLNLKRHINCLYCLLSQTQKLYRKQQFLNPEMKTLLVKNFIFSGLDYCNVLLNWISKYKVEKLSPERCMSVRIWNQEARIMQSAEIQITLDVYQRTKCF